MKTTVWVTPDTPDGETSFELDIPDELFAPVVLPVKSGMVSGYDRPDTA